MGGAASLVFWYAVHHLIIVAYGPFLLSYLPAKLTSPGFSFF